MASKNNPARAEVIALPFSLQITSTKVMIAPPPRRQSSGATACQSIGVEQTQELRRGDCLERMLHLAFVNYLPLGEDFDVGEAILPRCLAITFKAIINLLALYINGQGFHYSIICC